MDTPAILNISSMLCPRGLITSNFHQPFRQYYQESTKFSFITESLYLATRALTSSYSHITMTSLQTPLLALPRFTLIATSKSNLASDYAFNAYLLLRKR